MKVPCVISVSMSWLKPAPILSPPHPASLRPPRALEHDTNKKGLQANTLATFRVGVNVDIQELKRQSLGPLASLELESPPSLRSDPTAPAAVDDVVTTTTPPANASFRRSGPPPSNPVRPALRLKTATTPTPFAAPASGPARETWIPASSPAVSQMKREGFAVHDVTATVEGGLYQERPSLGRVQGDIDEEELRKSDDDTDAEACSGRGGSGKQGCLDYSECRVFATAPRAPRFAAFIADGAPQVRQWLCDTSGFDRGKGDGRLREFGSGRGVCG